MALEVLSQNISKLFVILSNAVAYHLGFLCVHSQSIGTPSARKPASTISEVGCLKPVCDIMLAPNNAYGTEFLAENFADSACTEMGA